MTQKDNITLKKMDKSHIVEVEALEAASFVEPWSAAAFLSEMETTGSVALVAVDEAKSGAVMGYVTARVVAGEAYINTIAVAAHARRCGIGRRLLSALEENVAGGDFITLEARESNHLAMSLYKRLGYEKVGMRKDFYREPVENAILMTKKLR